MTASEAPASPARRDLLRSAIAGAAALSACTRNASDTATPTVTDISQLDATPVRAIVRPASTEAVRAALAMHPGAVSIGGAHCSMGGQTAAPGSVHVGLHATPAQFLRAYPEARAFARLKREIDPGNRFRNRLWDRYLPHVA